ncbi:hypothetical protein AB7Y15_15660 [Morganella morganii]|uniref:hypothetical protein n=1 Tax=Morganella morganii TaxID=582 RepID=UPI0034E4A2D0
MKNPKLIVKPFAKNGQKNVIPENYETSMESNQATWDQGFGQITMLPVSAGGLPPKGQDFNGIFNQISENIVYLSQGGRFKFSAEYAEAIGGYPKGAILQSDDEKKEYLSLIDNNKVDFNTASDISASWKLVNTDDLLAQIASKQPKGDYATKTELNSGLAGKQPTGDYATNTALNNGLALKFDKAGGTISGDVTFSKNAVKSTKGTHTLPDKSGTLMQVGDFGVGGNLTPSNENYTSTTLGCGFYAMPGGGANPWGANGSAYILNVREGQYGFQIGKTTGNKSLSFRTLDNGEFSPTSVLYSTENTTKDSNGFLRASGTANALTTGNVVQSTGASATNVMSQKAVTDLIGSRAIGIGQTWQNMSNSRGNMTNYTNTTDRPIFVYIKFLGGASSVENAVTVDGINVGFASSEGVGIPNTIIVPPGSVYRVNTDREVSVWSELR